MYLKLALFSNIPSYKYIVGQIYSRNRYLDMRFFLKKQIFELSEIFQKMRSFYEILHLFRFLDVNDHLSDISTF